jgi:hypothetical protein
MMADGLDHLGSNLLLLWDDSIEEVVVLLFLICFGAFVKPFWVWLIFIFVVGSNS